MPVLSPAGAAATTAFQAVWSCGCRIALQWVAPSSVVSKSSGIRQIKLILIFGAEEAFSHIYCHLGLLLN